MLAVFSIAISYKFRVFLKINHFRFEIINQTYSRDKHIKVRNKD